MVRLAARNSRHVNKCSRHSDYVAVYVAAPEEKRHYQLQALGRSLELVRSISRVTRTFLHSLLVLIERNRKHSDLGFLTFLVPKVFFLHFYNELQNFLFCVAICKQIFVSQRSTNLFHPLQGFSYSPESYFATTTQLIPLRLDVLRCSGLLLCCSSRPA